MEIRKAKKQDLKEIAKIFWVESSKPPYNKKRTLERVIKIIQSDFKSSGIYVTILDKKIVGFTIVQRDSGMKTKLWINELWVLKEFQGKGIGRELMKKIEEIYKKKGIKLLELVADTERGGALKFYKKIGYDIDRSLVFMNKKV
jgi:ribosomal protein S18 acetylase RimI-like enzyme